MTQKVKLERLTIMNLISGAYLSGVTESDKVLTFAEMLSLAVFIYKCTSLFQISIKEKGLNYLDLVSAL